MTGSPAPVSQLSPAPRVVDRAAGPARGRGPHPFAFPWLASLLLSALLLVLPTAGWAAMVEVGQPAPLLRVHDLEGSAVVLGEAAPDRALLVMFSTIGCVPCRESEPLLAAAGEQYARHLAAACVMLAKPAAVRTMLAADGQDPALRFYADNAGRGLFPVAGAYGVMGTPTTYLIGRAGRVLWRRVGALTRQHIENDIPLALQGVGAAVGVASSRLLPVAD